MMGLLSGIWGKLAAAGTIVLGLLVLVGKLMGAGRDKERAAQAARVADRVKEANHVEDRVERAGSTELDGLHDKWTRKP